MDYNIVKFFNNLNDFIGFFFKIFTLLGEALVVGFIFFVIYTLIDKKLGYKLGIALIISTLFNNMTKGLVDRLRPFQKYDDIIVRNSFLGETHTSSSFPSGHTQVISTFLFFLCYYYKKYKYLLLSSLIILLVGLSRLYLGVHYLTDVLFAILLSFIIINILFKVNKKYLKYLLYILFIISPILIIFIKDRGLESYLKSLALFYGYFIGTFIEKKYINFEIPNSFKNKSIRLLLSGIILISIYLILKLLIDDLVFIRYLILSFSAFLLLPYLYKKFSF